VMAALWDSIPIRRCTSRPGSRSARCAPAQLGVALCPCDGTLPAARYRRVVDQLIDGISARPEILLDPLVARMERLSTEQRYEEAAWFRDRHDALARAVEKRRSWGAMTRLGLCEMESDDGGHYLLDHGRLVSSWSAGSTPPLRPAPELTEQNPTEVPESVEAAEEADLIWRWITTSRIRLLEATGSLSLPSRPVVRLVRSGG